MKGKKLRELNSDFVQFQTHKMLRFSDFFYLVDYFIELLTSSYQYFYNKLTKQNCIHPSN